MKIGDKVRFLNAVGGGIVKGFKNKNIVWVEEADGFETPVLIRECIVIESEKMPMKTPEIPNNAKTEKQAEQLIVKKISDEIVGISEKVKADYVCRQPPLVKKEKIRSIIEVDLHINQLLDNTLGMTNADMMNVQLSKFRQTMEENKARKGQKIVFIHGKGEGVLRNAILTELKSKYKKFPVQDASFKEYGFGATMVTIR